MVPHKCSKVLGIGSVRDIRHRIGGRWDLETLEEDREARSELTYSEGKTYTDRVSDGHAVPEEDMPACRGSLMLAPLTALLHL